MSHRAATEPTINARPLKKKSLLRFLSDHDIDENAYEFYNAIANEISRDIVETALRRRADLITRNLKRLNFDDVMFAGLYCCRASALFKQVLLMSPEEVREKAPLLADWIPQLEDFRTRYAVTPMSAFDASIVVPMHGELLEPDTNTRGLPNAPPDMYTLPMSEALLD
eukprot:TRINITY_DN5713_c0_g1_i1.p1 TRINITY_DN5713_c0_g1~~TRINITY_DN5713_c0_g1_i1.p1  ORF type:complete len:168 (+),score=33.16 TRINITY_DN5713_c0_g1_i1:405-908(+)